MINNKESSKTYRIKNHTIQDFKQIGDGDWKKGMHVSVEAWKILHKNPEIKLMNDVDNIMSDLKLFYPDNHYEHLSNFPAFFKNFLDHGVPDVKFFKKEMNKNE